MQREKILGGNTRTEHPRTMGQLKKLSHMHNWNTRRKEKKQKKYLNYCRECYKIKWQTPKHRPGKFSIKQTKYKSNLGTSYSN